MNFVSSTTYTERGQTSVISYGNATTSSYGYDDPATAHDDGMGWPSGVKTVQTGASLGLDLAYHRNAKGMINRIDALNTAGASDLTRSWTYRYDELDRLVNATNLASTNSFGPNGPGRNYAYDDADKRSAEAGRGCC